MLLSEIVEVSRRVSESSRRLEKIATLADSIRRMQALEVAIGVAFLTGELRQGRIGIGWASLRGAHEPAPSATLSLTEVDEFFGRIASAEGRGSSGERARLLGALMARATGAEQDFTRRLLIGELRQGAQQGVLLEAVARAAGVSASAVRRAAMLSGDLGAVAVSALEQGEAGLSGHRLELLRPIEPMLAQTAESPADALGRFGQLAAEYKLDGARVQIHRLGDEVRIFTRGLHDVTARAPEVAEAIRALPAKSLVLDGEAIVLRPDGTPQPFQTTMRRFGRRLDVDAMKAEFPLSPFSSIACIWTARTCSIGRPASVSKL